MLREQGERRREKYIDGDRQVQKGRDRIRKIQTD